MQIRAVAEYVDARRVNSWIASNAIYSCKVTNTRKNGGICGVHPTAFVKILACSNLQCKSCGRMDSR